VPLLPQEVVEGALEAQGAGGEALLALGEVQHAGDGGVVVVAR
jgi:hypothetical protein